MSADTCKNCGAWEGLHHYETMQCPRNGMEAPVGRKKEWMSTTFERNSDEIYSLRVDLATSIETANELRATIAEQDKMIAQARTIFENIFKRDWSNNTIITKAHAWLVANPAQDAERKTE